MTFWYPKIEPMFIANIFSQEREIMKFMGTREDEFYLSASLRVATRKAAQLDSLELAEEFCEVAHEVFRAKYGFSRFANYFYPEMSYLVNPTQIILMRETARVKQDSQVARDMILKHKTIIQGERKDPLGFCFS